MLLFNIDFNLLTNSGMEKPISPALIFSFNYIDQDLGWNKIANSFGNTNYFKDWNNKIIKFVVGFQNQQFFNLKQEEELTKFKLNEKLIEKNILITSLKRYIHK